jgi:hypothetical protein
MATIQIWADKEDLKILERLKAFLEHEQEKMFEGKAWRMHKTYGERRTKKRIRRKIINDSYIYRLALDMFWQQNAKFVQDFEMGEEPEDYR